MRLRMETLHLRHFIFRKATTAQRPFRRRACSALLGLVSLALAAQVAAQAPQCGYRVEHIIQGPPCQGDLSSTIGMAISPNGRWVVGCFRPCSISECRGFIYDTTTRQFTVLPLPPGCESFVPADVNDEGTIVGSGDCYPTGFRGLVYRMSTGQYTQLVPLPGGYYCWANGVNASNVVCGTRSIGPGEVPQTAFIWTQAGGYIDLGLINGQSTTGIAINNLGAVTGSMTVDGIGHPYLWLNGSITDLGSITGYSAYPTAINDFNEVLGSIATMSGNLRPHAFKWSGQMVDLGVLPTHQISHGLGFGPPGTSLGLSRKVTSPNDERAVVWRNYAIVDLNAILLPGSGCWLETAVTADYSGQILAVAIGPPPYPTISALLYPEFAASDVNWDCKVNVSDLLLVINNWGNVNSVADINRDGTVNMLDLYSVIKDWSPN